jgi:phosphomethylpyrimidine synthase
MCGTHCSMKITEDVRKYAVEQNINDEATLQSGMQQKPRDLGDTGGELYAKG